MAAVLAGGGAALGATDAVILDGRAKVPDLWRVFDVFTKNGIERMALPKDRTVYIYGEVGSETLAAARQISVLGKTAEPIYVVINSPGGSVFHGAAVIEAMESARGPVHTICVSFCASMAAFIFEYGDERMMFNRSMLMFHPASTSLGSGELDKMVSQLTAIQKYIRRIEEHVAMRVGISFDDYKYKSGVEIWLDSASAIEKKFADKVVYVDLPEDKLYSEM